MTDPIKQIVTEALTGTTDAEVAACRVTCNAVASQQMFCTGCNRILDQQTITVVTVKTPKRLREEGVTNPPPERRVVIGLCPDCWTNNEKYQKAVYEAMEHTQTPTLIENWGGIVFQQGDVE